jgi:hypothetical protein
VPSGWSASLSDTVISLGAGLINPSITLSVTSLPTAPEGNYTISVTATNDDYATYQGTGSATYKICEKACFPINWEGSTFNVYLDSNSTISNFDFNHSNKQIRFYVSGPEGQAGYCHVTIPQALISSIFTVFISDELVPFQLTQNVTHSFLYFEYVYSVHEVIITATPRYTLTISTPVNGCQIRTNTMTFAWSCSDLSSINRFEVQMDQDPWKDAGLNTGYDFPSVRDGPHSLQVKVVGETGFSSIHTVTFTVNTSLIGGPGWSDDTGIFLAVIIGGLVLSWTIRRSRKKTPRPEASPPLQPIDRIKMELEKERVLGMLNEFQEKYNKGLITGETYHRLQTKYENELKKLEGK